MGDYGGEFSAGRETIQGGAEKDTGCLMVSPVRVPCTWGTDGVSGSVGV